MARTVKPEANVNKPYWQKKGGGAFRFQGQRIKRDQIFQAYESEIPKAFRDNIKKVDANGQDLERKKAEAAKKQDPQIVRRAGAWWDVYDTKGKKVNERALRIKDAQKIYDLLIAKK